MLHEGAPCRAVRRAGGPCRAAVVLASGLCPAHDPARREALAAARVAGGRNKSRVARAAKLVPRELRAVLGQLMSALGEVRADTISPAQGSAMASLAAAIVRVYQVGVLEERLAALEAAAATDRDRGV